MKTKAEMIASLDESRQIMREVLRDLQSARDAGGEITPAWTIKEMLAHLTGWDTSSTTTLRTHAAGETPGTPAAADRNFVRFNAENIHAHEDLSLEQMTQVWEDAREAFKQAIRELPDDKAAQPFVSAWGQTIKLDGFVHIFAEHEIEHAHEVREKLLGHSGEAQA